MSSRNERLTTEERKEAAIIYKTLTEAKYSSKETHETVWDLLKSFQETIKIWTNVCYCWRIHIITYRKQN